MEENTNLALELLHEVKKSTKRYFILFLITLVLLFTSNLIWLYAWCLPTDETTVTQETDDDGVNNYIGKNGDIVNDKADGTNNNKRP